MHYLRLALWPHPLCLDYAWPVARSLPQIVFPGLVVLSLVAATLVALVRWPRVGFLASAFFLILAPTSSIVPIAELAFEYRMYLPLAPVIILVVLAAYHGAKLLSTGSLDRQSPSSRHARQLHQRRQTRTHLLMLALLAIVVAGLVWGTRSRNRDYQTEKSIWADTVEKSPRNARAHINLGNVYLGEGDLQTALRCYTQAIQVAPHEATAYNNRGRVLSDLKQFDRALDDYTQALEIDPGHTRTLHNRGNVYMEMQDWQKAVADHSRLLQLDPKAADSYFGRGTSYLQLGQTDAALNDLTSAIALKPQFPEAYLNRGSIYLKQRQFAAAIADFTSAIAQQPDLGAAYNGRALACLAIRQYDQSWQDVRTLEKLGQPIHPQILQRLRAATGLPR